MSLTTIKSYQNGIALHLDPTADFEDVLADVATKFEESRKFFKNAKVALSIEDRVLSEEEEKRIVVAINEHSDVNLMCLVGKNEETNRKYVKALKRMESQFAENNTRLYVGNINEGDIIESEGSLIVYGNVEMGGAAVAKKDIIAKANGKYKYFWLYRVLFGIPATNLATKGDSITFSTPTIEGTIFRRNKLDEGDRHPWKAEIVEDGTNTAIIAAWFTTVYEPDIGEDENNG